MERYALPAITETNGLPLIMFILLPHLSVDFAILKNKLPDYDTWGVGILRLLIKQAVVFLQIIILAFYFLSQSAG